MKSRIGASKIKPNGGHWACEKLARQDEAAVFFVLLKENGHTTNNVNQLGSNSFSGLSGLLFAAFACIELDLD